jgi:uncharacterized membrane protein YbhN (UPF0104 family)
VETPPGENARGRLRALASIATTIILLAAVAYIIWQLVDQWHSLSRHRWTLRLAPALLSLPLAAAWFLCRGWLWRLILARFGYPLAYGRAFRTFMLAELARYLPGTVWHVLGRGYYASRQGVPAAVTLTGMILEMALVALTAIAFLPLRAIGGGRLFQDLAIWAIAAVLVLLVFAHPRVIIPVVNAGLRRLKKQTIPAQLRYRDIAEMLGLCALMWVCMCGAFVLLAWSITPMQWGKAVAIAASFPAAWFAGLVSIVSPGGLGVREGALAALLSGLLPAGLAVVVALAARLWLTVVELVCAAVAWRLRE